MNAIEFVKSIGIERVSELVNECPENMHCIGKCGFSKTHWNEFACKNDLKQIVDAFDLVKSYGGLACARDELNNRYIGFSTYQELQHSIKIVEKVNASD